MVSMHYGLCNNVRTLLQLIPGSTQYAHIYIYIYIYIHTHIYICMCVCVCVCVMNEEGSYNVIAR